MKSYFRREVYKKKSSGIGALAHLRPAIPVRRSKKSVSLAAVLRNAKAVHCAAAPGTACNRNEAVADELVCVLLQAILQSEKGLKAFVRRPAWAIECVTELIQLELFFVGIITLNVDRECAPRADSWSIPNLIRSQKRYNLIKKWKASRVANLPRRPRRIADDVFFL
jgi:hypothetical protein